MASATFLKKGLMFVAIAIWGITIARLIKLFFFKINGFVDFYIYLDSANAIMQGRDPWNIEHLHSQEFVTGNPENQVSLSYPGQFFLFIPFVLLPPNLALFLYGLLNIFACGVIFYITLYKVNFSKKSRVKIQIHSTGL
jgi:hypothetical protein